MNDDKLFEALNRMLAQEHACAIRCATHAAVIADPYSETVSARLTEIGGDEILDVNIEEEKGAIRGYTEILESLSMSNVILFQTIQEIIRDEQEHLEELDALRHVPE